MTYASRLRARLDPQHPTNQSFGARKFRPSEDLVEREFQKKLTGGFDTSKGNRCDVCFMAKSSNNNCNCQ